MAEWVYVENGKVVGQYDMLPKTWKNISGLNLAANNLPFLKSLGWFPIIKFNEPYNNLTHFVEGYTYELLEDAVLEKNKLAERSMENSYNKPDKNIFFEELKNKRDQLLAASDWTQLVDVQETFDDSTKERWKIYRQKLRDIVSECEKSDIVHIGQVIWPEL